MPCDGRHTWESYAEGDLPAALVGADHHAVVAHPAVQQVCSVDTFQLASGVRQLTGWNLEVLPPAGANRTYRCLAGRGVDALAVPTLTGR
ncbi:hypothetical protein GCM10027452_41000 [Micromonospora halotolerans]